MIVRKLRGFVMKDGITLDVIVCIVCLVCLIGCFVYDLSFMPYSVFHCTSCLSVNKRVLCIKKHYYVSLFIATPD